MNNRTSKGGKGNRCRNALIQEIIEDILLGWRKPRVCKFEVLMEFQTELLGED